MILLTVQSYNGTPSAGGPSASFDELGGTIGRADHNQLVLPDPERTISRVHARVLFRASGYFIVDNGSNPISVNGTPVGAGREWPLKPGDKVEIGGYLLAVSEPSAAASDDPFADLFGDAAHGLAAPVAPKAPIAPAPTGAARTQARAAAPPWPAPAPRQAAPPYAPAASVASVSPFAPPATGWPPPPAAPAKGAAIPDDWDPFAPDAGTGASAPGAPVTPEQPLVGGGGSAAFGGVPAGGGASLDELFGLAGAPASADPLGATPSQVLGQPNTASGADPLQALAGGASATDASVPDHVSELNTPMPLPVAQPAGGPTPQPKGAVFSWDAPSREGRRVTLPPDLPPDRPRVAAPVADDWVPTAPAVARPAPPSSAAAVSTRSAADSDELLRALLEGLGSPGLRVSALTPETMKLVGELLREATRGAVELLLARAALKREMRAEMTMIVARENNPLKFSPTVDAALQHLLGERTPGFMAAAPAMRDAFDDLRAHQLGVMAGMRAALEGVLARFDPQQLEGKLTKQSPISSLIPAARKARLWELFQGLFAQLQSEAQDDFDELFGRAFLRAYEEQLDRLQGDGR
jgi:FHA domain-containing protein